LKTEPLLEIRELTVRRERNLLLSNVALDVARGSIHVVVGPNGAGKSTLFAAVLGLVEFDGTIAFNWVHGGRIGYVPQRFAVDRTMPLTVGDFLALSRQRRPVCFGVGRSARRRAETLLERVGLEGFLRRPMGGLSGGELLRVLFANAIDPVPEVLILDEPASGLDETAALRLEENLLAMQRGAGTTVLMISHDLAQARRIADRVTLLDVEVLRSGAAAAVLAGDLASSLLVGGARSA
jgi:zinc transport system ATP-binding protein